MKNYFYYFSPIRCTHSKSGKHFIFYFEGKKKLFILYYNIFYGKKSKIIY